jgi:hypothetical protein
MQASSAALSVADPNQAIMRSLYGGQFNHGHGMRKSPCEDVTIRSCGHAGQPAQHFRSGLSPPRSGRWRGVGYNFTDYSDDLADLSHRDRGFFINVPGKF